MRKVSAREQRRRQQRAAEAHHRSQQKLARDARNKARADLAVLRKSLSEDLPA